MRPTAASAVRSAYCVAVCSGLLHKAERYATKITVPIAPVKFSTMIVTVNAHRLTPTSACQVKTRFDAICRKAPIQRLVDQRIGARERAAGESADQRGREPDALDDGGVIVAGKSEIDHEGRGHGAGERIAKLVEHDEDENDDRHVAGEEIGKAGIGGRGHAHQRVLARMRGVLDGGGGGFLRLGRDERGRDADDDERRHGEIARAPGGAFAEAEALEIRSPGTARPRWRPACRSGTPPHRRPCRRPARSRSGFRCGRRR